MQGGRNWRTTPPAGGFYLLIEIVVICSNFSKCRRWDSNPHEVALTGFSSPANCVSDRCC